MFDELLTVTTPQRVMLETETDTKAPKTFGPFKHGLKCRRRMLAMVNFEKFPFPQLEAGYFKYPAWLEKVDDCPLGKKGDQLYLRFLILETLEEKFFHDEKEIEKKEALAFLPKRQEPNPEKPVYVTVKLDNVKHLELI